MIAQVRDEVRLGKFRGQLLFGRFRPLPVNKLEEIEADGHSIDPDEVGDMFDVIDVAIESRLFLARAYQHRINANYSMPLANHFDLLITDVAFNIVIFSRVRMRNNHGFARQGNDLLEASRIDVSKIDNHAERFAFPDKVAPKFGQSIAGRTAGCKDSAAPGRVASRMS